MTDKLYVGFTGYAGAGKDHVANALTDRLFWVDGGRIDVERVPWAAEVRYEIELALGITRIDKLWEKPTDTEMIRPLLQWWGTEFRRAQDPDYWVKRGLETAENSRYPVVFFTDTRFPNEVQAIRDAGGFIVNVCAHKNVREERIGKTPDHASEAEANTLPYDIRIWNNGEGTPHYFETFKAIFDKIEDTIGKPKVTISGDLSEVHFADNKIDWTVFGDTLHSPFQCSGQVCIVHSPTDHHMSEWRQIWRHDRGIAERICEHSVGHPDPDQFEFWKAIGQENWQGVHGCDGCCRPPEVTP